MKIKEIIISLLLICSIVLTGVYGKAKIKEEYSFEEKKEYKGILSLWQVDSFEGGVGSRKQFLLSVASSFEKQNDGVLIMVSNYSNEGVKEKFDEGIYPDIISYSSGVEIPYATELSKSYHNLGGTINEKVYGAVWCRGGYVVIGNKKLVQDIPDNIASAVVSQQSYTQPLLSTYLDGISVESYIIQQPMDAYVSFVSGKYPYLIGTQRDINRLINRGFDFISRPLTYYNDLYQYVSIMSKDSLKQAYASKFIDELMGEKTQTKLKNIGLYSTVLEVDYDNESMISMQKQNNFNTVNVFSSLEKFKELQTLSEQAIKNDEEAKIKIRNILF